MLVVYQKLNTLDSKPSALKVTLTGDKYCIQRRMFGQRGSVIGEETITVTKDELKAIYEAIYD